MGRKYQVISGDGHVETPPDVFVKYVPDKFKDRAPRLIKLPSGGEGWLIEGQPLLPNGQNITGRGPIRFSGGSYYKEDGSAAEGAGNAAQRLREQDEDGLDAEVLFPPVFASRFIEGIKDREVYCSMIRAYNRFLGEDYCSVAPDRLIGNAVMPITNLEDAVAELEFVASVGLHSTSFYQFPNGTGFWAPEDDRFWEKSLELGIKLSPHFGFGANAPAPVGVGRGTAGLPLETVLNQRAGSHAPVFCMIQLLCSGVFDRFPDIQFYFAETNASWLPSTLFMLDDNYALFKDWYKADWKMKPSEYIAKHCYFGIIRDPVAISMRDHLPVETLMWGSDFPHSVGSYPHSREFLEAAFDGVEESVRRMILLENPANYFGLDLDADITETPAA